jgi:hypothetical protein
MSFVPDFNPAENIGIGWLSESKQRFSKMKADDRFDFYSLSLFKNNNDNEQSLIKPGFHNIVMDVKNKNG